MQLLPKMFIKISKCVNFNMLSNIGVEQVELEFSCVTLPVLSKGMMGSKLKAPRNFDNTLWCFTKVRLQDTYFKYLNKWEIVRYFIQISIIWTGHRTKENKAKGGRCCLAARRAHALPLCIQAREHKMALRPSNHVLLC